MLFLSLVATMFLPLIALLIVFCCVWLYIRKNDKLLPPGPPGDLFIGHLRLLAGKNQEEFFHILAKEYGDIVYMHILGKPIIVLNSEEAAKELLDRQSPISSDRPLFPLLNEIGWGDMLAVMPYGERFITQRRLIQQPFTKQGVLFFRGIQEKGANELLNNLLRDPTSFEKHIHRMTSSTIVDITYGHHIASEDDEYYKISEPFISIIRGAGRTSLLDLFPSLRNMPEWMPGAWFVKYARESRPILQHMIDYPFEDVCKQMNAGKARTSIVSMHLESLALERRLTPEESYHLKMTAHQIYAGGAETTWGTLTVFIALMALHPDVQKRAQEEIDSVVGSERLPDFSDRDTLPYINAVVQETLRWYPVFPLGIPHMTLANSTYKGMFIPKGSTIIANSKTMALDENVYKDAHVFRPERFLPKPEGLGEQFSSNLVFGWGRRKCPGQYLADANVSLVISRILAVFRISKAKDKGGRDIEINLKFPPAVSSHPEPFQCEIQPRNPRATALVLEAFQFTS